MPVATSYAQCNSRTPRHAHAIPIQRTITSPTTVLPRILRGYSVRHAVDLSPPQVKKHPNIGPWRLRSSGRKESMRSRWQRRTFGSATGARERWAWTSKTMDSKKVMIVTDANVSKLDAMKQATEALDSEGVEYQVFQGGESRTKGYFVSSTPSTAATWY